MADILLQKPTAGTTTTINPQAQDRLVFDFDSNEATLSRDGDNLVMSFDDGSSVNLENFYEAYNAENMPTFLVEGREIDGESFFAALGEELMPAAGSIASSPQGSGSSVDTIAGTLLDGINRLGGLDQAYPDAQDEEDERAAAGDDDQGAPNGIGGIGGNEEAPAPDLAPSAFADQNQVTEGSVTSGNLLGNDVRGDSDDTSSGRDLVSVTPPEGWVELSKEALLDLGITEEQLDVSGLGSLEDYEFKFFDPETGDIFVVDQQTGDYGYAAGDNAFKDEDRDVVFDYTIEDADGDTSSTTLTVTVTDEEATPENPDLEGDETVLSLEATSSTEEGDTITYTVNITNAPTSDITVEVKDSLNNTHHVTIKAGETSGSIDVDAPSDDFYKDPSNVSASLGTVTEGGSEFENLTVDGSSVSTNVTDTIDSTTLTLKASSDNVSEGGKLDYTLELSNPTETEMKVTVTVNGVEYEVTIPENSTSATLTVDVAANTGGGSIDAVISKTEGGNFENVTTVGTPSVPITNVTLSPDAYTDTVHVDEEGLATGTDATANSEMAMWETPDGYTIVLGEDGKPLVTLPEGAPYEVVVDAEGNLSVTLKENITQTNDKGDSWDKDDAASGGQFTVTLKDALGNTVEATVDVSISDDAPVLSGDNMVDSDGDSLPDTSTATVTDGIASTEIEVDFGADTEGGMILSPDTGTIPVGVKWENGTWNVMESELFPGVPVDYSFEEGIHTIILGDVTMTSTDNVNWTVEYKADANDKTIIFKDGDGDSIKHTITAEAPEISFGDPAATSSTVTTYDAAVEGANASGEQPKNATSTAEGSFTITSEDGVASFEIGGVEFTVDPANGALTPDGSTQIKGEYGYITNVVISNNNDGTYTVEYEYTQTDSYLGGTDTSADGDNSDYDTDKATGESFDITVTDNNGDVTSAPGGIQVEIVDDVVSLTQVGDTTVDSLTSVSGTLAAQSADGVTSIDVTEVSIDGNTYTVVKGADGNYSVQDNGTEIGSITFTPEADGTTSWTLSVEDAELAGNADITFKATDKDGDTTTQTVNAPMNQKPNLDLTNSENLTTYDNEDDNRAGNSDGDNNARTTNGSFILEYGDGTTTTTLTGANGDKLTISMSIDDKGNPVIVYRDENNNTVDQEEATLDGKYGQLVDFNLDPETGEVTYTYTQTEATQDHDNDAGVTNSNEEARTDSFQITVSDSDDFTENDSATGSITVTIKDDGVQIHTDDAHVTKETYDELVVEWVEPTDGSTEYVPGTTITDVEVFKYTASVDGNSGNGTVSGDMDFSAADGATFEVDFIAQGKAGTTPTLTIEGEPVTYIKIVNNDGTITYRAGASDGWDSSISNWNISDPSFELTYDPENGQWSFEQYKPFDTELTLKFTATDGDGDVDTQYVVIQGTDDIVDIIGHTDVILNEAHLTDGTTPDADQLSQAGTVTVDGEKPESITIGNYTFTELNGEWTGEAQVDNGTVKITSVTTNPDGTHTVTYEYTLKESIDSSDLDPNDPDSGYVNVDKDSISFDMTIKGDHDSVGEKVTIDVTVKDDAPEAQSDVTIQNISGNDADGYTASTIVELNFGADDGEGKTIEFGGATFTYGEDGEWSSTDGGTILEDGSLSAGDMTLSQNGDTDYWSVTMSGDASELKAGETITFTDADGDSESLNITADPSNAVEGDTIGLAGEFTSLSPGANYNIAIMLDTSGSMYDDGNRDIIDADTDGDGVKDTISRLGQACDAIADFVVNILHDHANKGVEGGEVNVLITTFWMRSETNITAGNSWDDAYSSADGQSSGMTLNLDNFASMTEDQIYSEIAKILAMNAQGVEYTQVLNEDGTPKIAENGKPVFEFSYDEKAHKELTDALANPDKNADDVYDPLSPKDDGFHWGTEYHQGFETAAEWFESVSQEGFTNEAFLITDGAPYDSEAERSKAYNELLIAMGFECEKNDDGSYKLDDEGRYIPLPGQESKIHAVGVGAGANLGTLDKFDTTDDGAEQVNDGNITGLFDLGSGSNATIDSTHIGFTNDGSDVLMGDVNLNYLRKAFGAEQTGVDAEGNPIYADTLDDSIIDFLRNNPEWLLDEGNLASIEYGESAANNDALIAGSGDDFVYGQGGDDILIGDGDQTSLETLAEKLEVSGDYSYENVTDATDENLGSTTANLVDALLDKAQEKDADGNYKNLEELEEAATAMESDDDGNDVLFGGDGKDILLGLGGDDFLNGGDGSDILLGGSGDDYLSGGRGDMLLGGSGNDLIKLGDDAFSKGDNNELSLADLFVDGGQDSESHGGTDVLLTGAGSIDAVKDALNSDSGKVQGIEVFVAGDVDGNNTSEVLQNAGAQDGNGAWTMDTWTRSDDSGVDGFFQYTKDDITILIQKTLLEN